MTTGSMMLSVTILGTVLALPLRAQAGGPGSGRPIANPPPQGGRNANSFPSSTASGIGRSSDNKRQIFMVGMVMMDDGSPPPESVTIEITCGGRPRPYGITDSAGAFNINYGQPDSSVIADPSYASPGRAPNDPGGVGSTRSGAGGVLTGCELSARLPGFRSDSIQLSDMRQLDDPNVGTIFLHRLANVTGYTFSMTTMNAPKKAQKEFEKGLESARKTKWPEAESQFRKAVADYPKYAICWEALGRTLEMQQHPAEARQAYEEAAKSDSRFVTPYLRLMVLSGREEHWEDVAKNAATVVQLDPTSYPIAYYFSGIAYSNLKREDEAEKSVRAGLKVDSRGTVPRLNHLLGTLLLHRGAYAEALPYLRAYLQNQPDTVDAGAIKGEISYAEKMTAGAGANTPER